MSNVDSAVLPLVLPDVVVYPQRPAHRTSGLERIFLTIGGFTVARLAFLRSKRSARIVDLAREYYPALAVMDDDGIWEWIRSVRAELRRGGFKDAAVSRAFALVREVAERAVGHRPSDTQLIGGLVILKGQMAEIQTDEDRTWAITFAAATAALAGRPVHVVTSADIFTDRDIGLLRPVYESLGLRVSAVTVSTSSEDRYSAYRSDVTYCAGRQVAFDYLRDRLALGGPRSNLQLKFDRLCANEGIENNLLLRGLRFAIVNDADRVLIDDAHAPLVITKELELADVENLSEQAFEVARTLEIEKDYTIHGNEFRVELTDSGKDRTQDLSRPLKGPWRVVSQREEMVIHALMALFVLKNDEHYRVEDGKVQITDTAVGRLISEPRSGEGLMQMVEVKEGCQPTKRKVPASRLAYPNYFLKYQSLGGVTKTASEAILELWMTYRLAVIPVPAGLPRWRQRQPDQILPTVDKQLRAVVKKIHQLLKEQRPVIVGACSPVMAERIADALKKARLGYEIVDALRGQDEVDAISRIVENGMIGVVVNISIWRGYDVHGSSFEDKGAKGLSVILTESQLSKRLDRRVAGLGRSRGEPPLVEKIFSLEDPILEVIRGGFWERLITYVARSDEWRDRTFFSLAQRLTEAMQYRQRREILNMDQRQKSMLAISGRSE